MTHINRYRLASFGFLALGICAMLPVVSIVWAQAPRGDKLWKRLIQDAYVEQMRT